MTLKRFLYFLLKPDGRSGKVNNGVVTYSGTPTPLPQTPQGWEDILIGWERSLSLHGILRTFTLPLGFVRDGAQIIRDAVYKQSIEEPIQLLILKLVLKYTPSSFNWFYEYFYRGEIDLSTTEDEQDFVQVSIMEGGITKLLKANEKTVYDFSFDNDSINIEMDGIDLNGSAKYLVPDGIEIDNAVYSTHWMPFSLISVDGIAPGISFVSQNLQDTTGQSVETRMTSNNYFAVNTHATNTINLRLKGQIKLTVTKQNGGNSIQFRFYRSSQTTANQSLYQVGLLVNPFAGSTHAIDVDIVIPLGPGEKMFFEGRVGNSGVHTAYVIQPETFIYPEFTNRFDTTYIPAFTRDVLYRKLVGRILGDESLAVSQLCSDNQNLCITSFDAVRGFQNATVKVSLTDFFSDTDCTLCAGMGIEDGKLVLEKRSYFYNSSAPVSLGRAKEVKHTPSVDLLYNTFKFGHQKPNIEDVNGKYDPNGSTTWTGPLTRVVKEYNMVSPWKAGPMEIELTRVNLDGKTSTDTQNENEVCVINANGSKVVNASVIFNATGNSITIPNGIKLRAGQRIRVQGSTLNDAVFTVLSVGSIITAQLAFVDVTVVDEASVAVTLTFETGAVYTLTRVVYDTLEGVPNQSIFNIEQLTPKRMFQQHWEWIRSMHYGLDSQKLVFAGGDKNYKLKTVLGSVEFDEDADVQIVGMGNINFKPIYDTFKTEVPVNLATILETNRCFSYIDENGDEWVGFVFAAGIAPNTMQEQEFKLLMAPQNDLTKLVD